MRERFTVYSVEGLRTLPDPDWLIGGMLPAGGAAELVGRPGVGKTFVALDLALHISSAGKDAEWFGRPIRRGRVLYLSAEGQTFFRLRVDAALAAMGLTTVPDFLTVLDAVNLVDLKDVAAFEAAVRPHADGLALLILDTRQRCTAGSRENDSEDQGLAIAAVDHLRRTFECAVLTLHHPNAEGSKGRGWTGWDGALDAILALEDLGDGLQIRSTKVKDGPALEPIRLRLMPYQRSAVVVEVEDGGLTCQLTPKALKTLEALAAVETAGGITPSVWQQACDLGERGKSTFWRHRKVLLTAGLVQELGKGRYATTDEGRERVSHHSHGTAKGLLRESHKHSLSLPGGDSPRSESESGAVAGLAT